MDSGDFHIWKWIGRAEETKMNFRYELEAFDRLSTRFSSEYGFHGALMYSSVKRYHDGENLEINSPIWTHHGEHPRKHQALLDGIQRHLCNIDQASVEDYLLYSGVLQGCLYGDMAVTLRSKEYCSGNLIWMYNDCWPETGWTIIDYYLTRKISYYFLKRAYEPKKFIIKRQEGKVRFLVMNESGVNHTLQLEYGYVKFNGEKVLVRFVEVEVSRHSTHEFTIEEEGLNCNHGCYYMKATNSAEFTTVSEVRPYYRSLELCDSNIEMSIANRTTDYIDLSIVSDEYVPIAYLTSQEDSIHYSDNYFELLPHEAKHVRVYHKESLIELHQVRIEHRSYLSDYDLRNI